MRKTKIEWSERVWNPITGCDKVSAGCKHCYAETIANRFWVGRKFTDVICHDDRLEIPLKWRKPKRIFVNSMSDLFHEKVPFEFIEKVYNVMLEANHHIFQVLTKRPDKALEFFEWIRKRYVEVRLWDKVKWPLPNIWPGTSIENQEQANKRIPLLLQIPAAVRWLSVEPMLGEVDLTKITYIEKIPEGMIMIPDNKYIFDCLQGEYSRGKLGYNCPKIDWVVCGAESGAGARPMKIEWAESLLEQCKQAGVPFFMKQLCHKGRKLKFEDWPKHLQVREYPGSN